MASATRFGTVRPFTPFGPFAVGRTRIWIALVRICRISYAIGTIIGFFHSLLSSSVLPAFTTRLGAFTPGFP